VPNPLRQLAGGRALILRSIHTVAIKLTAIIKASSKFPLRAKESQFQGHTCEPFGRKSQPALQAVRS